MADLAKNRRGTLALIACVTPFLVLVVFFWGTGPDAGNGDYAQYLLHAKALLEGRSYTDIGYIYTERNPVIGPRAYSPGLPLTLAATNHLLGWTEDRYPVVPFLGALAFLLIVGFYFKNIEASALAPLVVLICGLVPGLAQDATLVGTDLVFAAFAWGIIYMIDAGGERRLAQLAVLSVLGVVAVMFRPSGVALIPAVVVFALMKRREGELRLLVPAAAWVLAFISVNAILPVSTSYADQVAFDAMTALRTAVANLWAYRLAVFESHLYPFRGPYVSDAYHVITAILMLIGFFAWFPRLRRRFLFNFALFYFLVHLVFTYTASRYLWPLFPVFAFGLLKGAQQALVLMSRRQVKEAPAVAIIGVTVALLALLVLAGILASDRPVPFLSDPRVVGLIEQTRSFGGESRVAFFNPRVLTLTTDAAAIGLFVGSPDEIVDEFCDKGITLAITGDFGTEEPGHPSLQAAVAQRPGSFDLAWENEEFALYRFNRSACTTRVPAADRG